MRIVHIVQIFLIFLILSGTGTGNTNDSVVYVDGSYYVDTYLPKPTGSELPDQGNNNPFALQTKSQVKAKGTEYFLVNNSSDLNNIFWENVTAVLNTTVNCSGAHIYIEEGYTISSSELIDVCETVDDSIDFITNNLNAQFPDKDGDPKIYVLILDLNSRRPANEAPFGYFRSGDQLNGNTSNKKDMIYFNINRVDHIETLPHELTHLANYNYDTNEELWLNEGMAQYSQLALFDEPQGDSLKNRTGLFENYYPTIKLDWLTYDDDLTIRNAQYGSSFLFVWYLSEQYGGGSIISDILKDSKHGVASVRDALPAGVTFEEVFSNWLVANYVDDPDQNPKWGYETLDFDVHMEPVEEITDYNGGSHSFTQANMDQWSSAYYRIESDADAFDTTLDEAFLINSIRLAGDGTAEVRQYTNNPGNSYVSPDTTVTNADKYDETVLVVSALDDSGDYQLSLGGIDKLESSVPDGGSVVFVCPVEEGTNYSRHGNLFTSVWWENAANIGVYLGPVGFTTTVDTLQHAIPLKQEHLGHNGDSTEIWKLEIRDNGVSLGNEPFGFTSNYYDGQLDGDHQVHTLPTVLKITPRDMIVEDESDTIEFDVEILDGNIPFSYTPFAAPTSQNFEVNIGGVGAESINVVRLSQNTYRLTVDPAQFNPGYHDLEVDFTYIKFGVSNTASTIEKDIVLHEGNGSDIVLVIDSSGSMRSTDPYNLRKEAARLFVDLAHYDDQIAVVDFDGSAHLRASLCNVGENRRSLKSAINAIDSSGGTNIGSGLNAGYNQLNGGNAMVSHIKGAILLSDGIHEVGTHPSSVVPSYVSNGWPIYTIAHSNAADEELMNNIAQTTGGKYYKTDEAWDLLSLYLGIHRDLRFIVADIYQIHRKTQTISAGTSIERVITMDSSISFAEIVLFNRESDSGSRSSSIDYLEALNENESENGLDYIENKDLASEKGNSQVLSRSQDNLILTLYYPNGTAVSLNTSSTTGTNDPDIIHISSDYYEIYKINKQLPGNWTYNITSNCNSTQEYALFVNANTSIKFEAALDKEEYFTGEQVRINANLFNETQGFENATVTAYMTLPDRTTFNISLNDSGNGYYEGSVVNLSQEGTYEILVEAIKGNVIRQEILNFDFEHIEVDFTADATVGFIPLTVNFTDLSTGGSQWKWDVDGDNITDYVTRNVSHTYDSPGVYNVSLSVGNENVYINRTKPFYIQIYNPGDVVNSGFETGDLYGWTVNKGQIGSCSSEVAVAENYNHSGNYGCQLHAVCANQQPILAYVSLDQNINLTGIDVIEFSHQLFDGYSPEYCELTFYVDEDMTVIPFSHGDWKQESINVSNYSGTHNVKIRLQASSTATDAKVWIDDFILVPTPDWNPWNEPDSAAGRRIDNAEIQEAYACWLNNISAPYTGAEINTIRMNALRYYWTNGLEMPEGTENAPLITAERCISGYNVAPNSTFTVSVDMNIEMQPDQYLNSLTLNEEIPSGWNITSVDDSGWVFDSSTAQWSHNSVLLAGGNFTFVYNVTVPANSTGGIYNISGQVSAMGLDDIEVGGDSEVYVIDNWNSWNELVNGGFETGDFFGWTIETSNISGFYQSYCEYEVAAEHNHSGTYGCELNVSRGYYGYSLVSLTQAVNLTNVTEVAFNHRQTYEQNAGPGFVRLEFYIDDERTAIPFSNNTWKQESINVSEYSGDHNITIQLLALCPVQYATHQATVEIDDITLIPTPDDWNPWNDPDSSAGRRIANNEIQVAVFCWKSNDSAPYTGAEINTIRLNALRYYWANVLEMPEGTETAPQVSAGRSISGYNVTPDSNFTISVDMNIEMQPDQYLHSLTLDEDFPAGWNITSVDDSGWVFDSSTVQWSHNSTLLAGGNFTFVYNVTVPGNSTGGIYNISGLVLATGLDDVKVGGNSEVYVMDDWNPWNDWDSEGDPNGRYITYEEVTTAQDYWESDDPAPRTGAYITTQRLFSIFNAWRSGEPM
jgi:PKD repeat protein/Mg-chelatase subunit ChlD